MSFAIPVTKRPPNVHMYTSLKATKIYEEQDLPVLPPMEICSFFLVIRSLSKQDPKLNEFLILSNRKNYYWNEALCLLTWLPARKHIGRLQQTYLIRAWSVLPYTAVSRNIAAGRIVIYNKLSLQKFELKSILHWVIQLIL